jgi:TetR/AcrR family transcriptional regulator
MRIGVDYLPKQTFYNLPKEKQEQIINAAINEFSQFSFNEVKISDIINKAKIPRTSFYDYFEDKKDLYKHIILIIKEEKMKFMAPVFENQQDNFFERLRELFKAGVKFASLRPEYEKLGIRMYENLELINDILEVKEIDVSSFYEFMIINGIRTGEIRSDIDVKFAAKSISIISSNLMAEGFEERQGSLNEFIEEIADKIIDFIRHGIAS